MNCEIDKENNLLTFNKLNSENIINAVTLKPYNFNANMVSEEEIQEQFNKLKTKLGAENKIIKSAIQTHTNIIKKVTKENINEEFTNVDGLVTNLKDVLLITRLADCQGILLYDSEKQVIGNVHSGWKGTLNKIIENAVKLMENEYNSKPENIQAYIVPSILKCCFEVDEDVKNMFLNKFQDIKISELITKGKMKEGKQKYYIDTVEINKRVMMKLGIKEENIILSNICTKCNSELFHSYRKEKERSGRHIAIIGMKEN